MQRVLITGVAGMIGSHLLDRLLDEGHEVIGIDNLSYGKMENIQRRMQHPSFKFYNVDILDFDTLKILSRDVQTILHLAAVKKVSEAESSMDTLKVNTKGTEFVFEAAKMWRAKVVFASTSDVYGMSPDLPFKEDGDLLLGPSMIKRWSYSVSKLYGEQLAFGYHQDYGVPTVILRYFGGFSPRSSFFWSGGHIPIFIKAILEDQEVPIHGDGQQRRSMAHVNDLVAGTMKAMVAEEAVGEVINLGNDEEVGVLESAEIIHRLADTGKELKLKFIPFDEVFGKNYKDIMRRIPDLTKARKLLGYAPKYTFEKAILDTLEKVRERGDDQGGA